MRTRSRLFGLTVALSFSLVGAVARAGTGVTPSDATPVQREEAQSHFARGRDLYSAKKFDEAAAEFDRSYAIVASPNALFFLARCDRERGKLVAAYSELGRTAAEAREHASEDPRYAKTAEAATEERNAVALQLGFVTVIVNGGGPDTVVTIGGDRFPRAALGEPFPVMPGSTQIVVDTPGAPPLRQTVSASGGEKKTVSFDVATVPAAGPPPESVPSRPAPAPGAEVETAGHAHLRTVSYVAAGVAAVGLITFAAAGVASNNAYNQLEGECHGPCPAGAGHQSEIDNGKTEQTVADVGLIVGVAGAGAAIALFVMSIPSKSDKVSLSVGPTWVGIRGEF